MQTMKAALVAAIGVVALICCLLPSSAEENGRLALIVSIDGAIGPASASYVKEALVKAAERRPPCSAQSTLSGRSSRTDVFVGC